jgi:hypothetical protein
MNTALLICACQVPLLVWRDLFLLCVIFLLQALIALHATTGCLKA